LLEAENLDSEDDGQSADQTPRISLSIQELYDFSKVFATADS
jgi:hypothetical protein